MKYKWYLFLTLFFLLDMLLACSKREPTEKLVELEDLEAEWIVVNYWASWCKPCLNEIPELNQLYKIRDNVAVVGVNYDGMQGAELEKESSRVGINFPNLSSDPASKLNTVRPVVLPTTLVLDENLKLRSTLLGPQTLSSITATIRQLSGDIKLEKSL